MKNRRLLYVLLIFVASPGAGQSSITKTQKFVNAAISATNELVIAASKNSNGFDFQAGNCNVRNKRLKTRLNKSTEWLEFGSTVGNQGQACSADSGETWGWNSFNVSSKMIHAADTLPVPEPLMPGIISTDSLEFGTAYSPDGNAVYFTRSINKQTKIIISHKTGTSWSAPEPVSFSTEKISDADPAFSPTGELYFISTRPRNTNDSTKDYDIWKVIPKASGTMLNDRWSAPINVSELNSEKDEFYISFTRNGDVCFSSSREGGFGNEDIYYSVIENNKFGEPQNLGDNVNSIHSEYDPFITANGSGLIFTSSGRKDSFGKGDLYWSVRSGTTWAEAKHLGKEINTVTRDFCPYVTSDSKYFYYSSHGDIKFVPTENLPEELRFFIRK
jgi:hypothetical protein